ncbi:SIMPL domain-containing protein [Sunxiuqinia sp. A32]|uniref:SIMPL domain-containing protein n=1 Tax=Sunxiuqinia sp. A32 TaxID=3461496 RepID=UPI004045E45A
MKTIKTFALILFLPIMAFAQPNSNSLDAIPYIEVTGEGELEIVPDEIFLQLTLKEKYDGNKKTSIDVLERNLKQQLQEKGIDLTKLTLADADAAYVKIKRKNKDVLASKDYLLEVNNTTALALVWEILDEIEVQNAYIKRVDHSNMKQLEKDVKINAILHAKEKANYLLSAVNKKVGKVLLIQERENYNQIPLTRVKLEMATLDERNDSPPVKESEITFQKIKMNYKVFARFAIE